MNSILSKAKLGTQPGGRPPAAVEITPEGVLAAAIPAPGQPPVYAFEPLAPGALLPGIGEPNLRAPDAVADAIRSTLDQVSPRTRAVTLVVPDTVVRVFVLDFDSLPSKSVEAFPVLRFRLRKMVPFDVEHAGLSYQVLTENKNECKVLAAVLPGPVLAEYEGAVRAAGYEPGAVLSSSLAALETVDFLEAVLIANLSPLALTTCILRSVMTIEVEVVSAKADSSSRWRSSAATVALRALVLANRAKVMPNRAARSPRAEAMASS